MKGTPETNRTRGRIFLIRHARPLVSKKGYFSRAAASSYISDYDAAEVEQFVMEHEAIPYQEVRQVYCSTLVRSQLTARQIFGEEVELIVRHEFREFERRIFSLPLLRLPIRLWLVSARVLWMMGLNSKGIETFRQAKQRAREAASFLAQQAEHNPTVVLVAHGLLNNFIRWYLQDLGWKPVIQEGSGFLSVTMLEKK
ncbi:phosphoglycerate mutase family protein [Pontibacter sp. HSC-14F20]|uniref:histidine phosphatase family protein n=1 Tax=Pontibacter sp. HSC-14F20 TaxID=2864136 RepID=UPI001C7329C7|nr:histidine phosphatase family protein [Pontibacter sp. HSC-14F20]MBX0333282.1 phosphoglycerate mutase family protein [Pontibacter sp. HSC-14F20]